jgi:hypothetical protein
VNRAEERGGTKFSSELRPFTTKTKFSSKSTNFSTKLNLVPGVLELNVSITNF